MISSRSHTPEWDHGDREISRGKAPILIEMLIIGEEHSIACFEFHYYNDFQRLLKGY